MDSSKCRWGQGHFHWPNIIEGCLVTFFQNGFIDCLKILNTIAFLSILNQNTHTFLMEHIYSTEGDVHDYEYSCFYMREMHKDYISGINGHEVITPWLHGRTHRMDLFSSTLSAALVFSRSTLSQNSVHTHIVMEGEAGSTHNFWATLLTQGNSHSRCFLISLGQGQPQVHSYHAWADSTYNKPIGHRVSELH